MATFCETKLTIISLLEQLQEAPSTSFERLVVCEEDECFTLSAANMSSVDEYLQKLELAIEANRQKASDMRKRIDNLMDKLQIDPNEKMNLHEMLGGHSPDDLKELKRKLDELEVLKMEKMEDFIKATRNELSSLWDLCYYSQSQREKFAPYYSISHSKLK